MSTTHELPVAESGADQPHTTESRPGLPTAARIGIAAVTLAVVGAGVAVAVGHRSAPAPKATDAITLPATLDGLSPLPKSADQTQSSSWQAKAEAAGNGATVTGRSYGTGTPGARSIRIVAGRTDLTGALEQAWAAGTGDAVGADHCTNNVRLTANGAPRVRPTVMLCWRTSATFSAYSVIIDPKATAPVTPAEGAAALDTAWAAATDQQ